MVQTGSNYCSQVGFNHFGLRHCYTLEASLAGGDPGGHYGIKDYQRVGHDLMLAIHEWNEVCFGENPITQDELLARIDQALGEVSFPDSNPTTQS